MSRYLDLFLAESREHLAAMEEDLARLGSSPESTLVLFELFRRAHSLKGMAASMGLLPISELAHAMEDVLDRVRAGRAPLDDGRRETVEEALGAIAQMLDLVAAGQEPVLPVRTLLLRLRLGATAEAAVPESSPALAESADAPSSASRGAAPRRDHFLARDAGFETPRAALPATGGEPARAAGGAEPPPPAPGQRSQSPEAAAALPMARPAVLALEAPPEGGASAAAAELEHAHGLLLQCLPAAPPSDGGGRPAPAGDPAFDPRMQPAGSEHGAGAPSGPGPAETVTIRIPAASLDRFLDTIGELIVERGRLASRWAAAADRSLAREMEGMSRLIDRLYGNVMALRLLPFDTLSHRFTKAVRDLARRQGKSVDLRIAGGEVRLDRSVLEALIDPINHILRNAIDHGIEPPARRLASGRPARGTVTLSLARAGEHVTIRIQDDGCGMDPAAIKRAALSKGFITLEAARSLRDQEALALTMIPGFSTSETVTELSGRGVGMDVVRTRVESLGGRLGLKSRPGEGLTVEIRLPHTIEVVQAFVVAAGGRRWAVPVSTIRRTFEIAPAAMVRSAGGPRVLIGGEPIPLVDLAAVLGLCSGGPRLGESRHGLLVREGHRSVAFAVDQVQSRQEIVVKPLKKPLEEMRGFTGATILGDGSIVLILDLLGLDAASPGRPPRSGVAGEQA